MALKSEYHRLAIVGINRESANLLSALVDSDTVTVVRNLNPAVENVSDLAAIKDLDVIVDTTHDPAVAEAIKRLRLPDVDVIGALSARILFLSTAGEESRVQDRERILESLGEVRQAVMLSKNADELLKVVLNLAIRSNHADSGSIMMVEDDRRHLRIEIADGIDPGVIAATIQRVGKGVAGRAVRTRKPLLINGALESKAAGAGYHRTDRLSSICCPLMIGREAVGVININSTRQSKPFTGQDLAYMRRFAQFVAEVIKTSRQLVRTASSRRVLSTLDTARHILGLRYPLDERLNLLLLKTVNALDGEICNFYLFHPAEKAFFIKASSSFKISLLKGKTLKFNEYLTKQALARDGAVCIDVEDAARRRRKWYITRPVAVDGRMIGLLFAHFFADQPGVPEQKEIVDGVADLLSRELTRDYEIETAWGRSVKFSAVSEASFDIADARGVTDLARLAVANACLILEAESAVLRLIDEDGTLALKDSFSVSSLECRRQVEGIDEAVAKQALHASPVVMYTSESLDEQMPACAATALSMRLNTNGHTRGTLSIYNKKAVDLFGSRDFSQTDKDVFISFCLQIAKAYDRLESTSAVERW